MNTSFDQATGFQATDHSLLEKLRAHRRGARLDFSRDDIQDADDLRAPTSRGQRLADAVAAKMGSWRFIVLQSVLLALWMVLNVTAYVQHWDPYPFILLNLMLSFQAAYTAPIIMMSQNRQQEIDRRAARNDYRVNIKAELEIELLHQKIDQLREKEVLALTKAVENLTALLSSGKAER
jgi:uncharacterized membrane protein